MQKTRNTFEEIFGKPLFAGNNSLSALNQWIDDVYRELGITKKRTKLIQGIHPILAKHFKAIEAFPNIILATEIIKRRLDSQLQRLKPTEVRIVVGTYRAPVCRCSVSFAVSRLRTPGPALSLKPKQRPGTQQNTSCRHIPIL